MMRKFRDVEVECAPGDTGTLVIPLSEDMRKGFAEGNWALCRITVLDPKGFCPVTADLLIVPESISESRDEAMPVGPDAVL